MKISIFGLGYVGAVSLACLARDGHEVIGVDIDQAKLDMLQSGQAPIVEEGIQELTKSASESGRVSVTSDASFAIQNTDISFVCVGTPSLPNGDQDLGAICRLSEQIGAALKDKEDFHTLVIRSTVQPGTVEATIRPILEQYAGADCNEKVGLCFQPEFLREGSSIKDYDHPPFTIIGTQSERALSQLREVFGHLPCEFIQTKISTAEMMKYACNIFHAVKITFANEMGRISQVAGVDSLEVMDLVCRDTRLNISPAYLRPGFAYGGSCLPKDLKALMYRAKLEDAELPMLGNVMASNQVHIEHAIERVLTTGKKKVGMIGLSFKSGTDDLRESPLVVLAERFIGKGLDLQIYDPEVNMSRLVGANRRYIEDAIPHIGDLLRPTCEEVVSDADVVIVGLAGADIFASLNAVARADQYLLDLVHIPEAQRPATRYQGVCW